MQIGPNQHEVATIDLSSRSAIDLNNIELRANLFEGLTKRWQSCVIPTKTDECELATNSIVQRVAVVQPDMG